MNVVEEVVTKGSSGILLHVISSILIRWTVALGSYSGRV